MNNTCGWIALAGSSAPRAPLIGTQQADYLVIGAGITGLSAAHALSESRPDARIVVLDRQRAAQGASGRNSGFVVAHEHPGAHELIGQPGFADYQADTAISRAANDEVRSRLARHGIDCEWRDDGYLFAVNDPGKLTDVDATLATLRAVGAQASFLQGNALQQRLGTAHYQAAIQCGGGNALLQPAKYVRGLLDALPAAVTVFENTAMSGLTRLANGRWRAHTRHGGVEAPRVLVCLNAFVARAGLNASGTFPMELSASLTRPLTDAEMADVQPWGVLSTRPLGATVRFTPDRRVMIRNTAEYRGKDLSDHELLQRREHHLLGLQRRFPWLTAQDIRYTWTGHLSASRSGQPYFAQVDDGLYAVAGCNGSGVARGTLWGRLLAELACDQRSPLLTSIIERARPGWLPPRPLLDIGAILRMRVEAIRARTEI
ncbi:NAD(P)/FAD-dependent oxidoreductase [Pseudomonas putida]